MEKIYKFLTDNIAMILMWGGGIVAVISIIILVTIWIPRNNPSLKPATSTIESAKADSVVKKADSADKADKY